MAESPVVFIDIETLGLEPERHAVWEIALIARRPGEAAIEREWTILLSPEELALADSTALRLNRFYERYDDSTATSSREVAVELAKVTAGAAFVAANPNFDATYLERFLRRNGLAPAWHYRLCCVENLAAGRLGVRAGWDPKVLSEMLGVERPEDTKHAAMADAKWAMRMYDAVFSAPPLSRPAPAAPSAPEPEPILARAPEPPAEAKESVSDVLARLREGPNYCEDCKTGVEPEAAVLSYAKYQKVLCPGQDGCFSRYGVAS